MVVQWPVVVGPGRCYWWIQAPTTTTLLFGDDQQYQRHARHFGRHRRAARGRRWIEGAAYPLDCGLWVGFIMLGLLVQAKQASQVD